MAKRLKLDGTWIDDDTLRISWMDTKAIDRYRFASFITSCFILGLFFIGVYISFTDGGFTLFFVSIVAAIIWSIYYRVGSISVRNHVDFSSQTITFKGRSYDTDKITRFDYGVKSQLTGITPGTDGNGNVRSDPTLVRMWVGDSAPVTISENNWAFDVCHAIRDALDQALQTVRADAKAAATEAEFGKSGEFGVPDY